MANCGTNHVLKLQFLAQFTETLAVYGELSANIHLFTPEGNLHLSVRVIGDADLSHGSLPIAALDQDRPQLFALCHDSDDVWWWSGKNETLNQKTAHTTIKTATNTPILGCLFGGGIFSICTTGLDLDGK